MSISPYALYLCLKKVYLGGDGLPVEMVGQPDQRHLEEHRPETGVRWAAGNHRRRLVHEWRGGHPLPEHHRPVHVGVQVYQKIQLTDGKIKLEKKFKTNFGHFWRLRSIAHRLANWSVRPLEGNRLSDGAPWLRRPLFRPPRQGRQNT